MIGNTPMIKLNKILKEHNIKCQVYCKFEGANPGGSIKDRIAHNMMNNAEKKNLLKVGDQVIESTSGNTGMGLTLVSAIKGYKQVITIPDKMSNDKVNRLKLMGAKVHVCPTEANSCDPRSYKGLAHKIADEPNTYYPDQYTNNDNPGAHVKTTGPEIYDQMDGKIDYFIAGVGTGGTITGVSEYLKS